MSDICGGYPPSPCPTHSHTGHPQASSIHGTAFTGGNVAGLVIAVAVLLVVGLWSIRWAGSRRR